MDFTVDVVSTPPGKTREESCWRVLEANLHSKPTEDPYNFSLKTLWKPEILCCCSRAIQESCFGEPTCDTDSVCQENNEHKETETQDK